MNSKQLPSQRMDMYVSSVLAAVLHFRERGYGDSKTVSCTKQQIYSTYHTH
jgi:hypothetical protein